MSHARRQVAFTICWAIALIGAYYTRTSVAANRSCAVALLDKDAISSLDTFTFILIPLAILMLARLQNSGGLHYRPNNTNDHTWTMTGIVGLFEREYFKQDGDGGWLQNRSTVITWFIQVVLHVLCVAYISTAIKDGLFDALNTDSCNGGTNFEFLNVQVTVFYTIAALAVMFIYEAMLFFTSKATPTAYPVQSGLLEKYKFTTETRWGWKKMLDFVILGLFTAVGAMAMYSAYETLGGDYCSSSIAIEANVVYIFALAIFLQHLIQKVPLTNATSEPVPTIVAHDQQHRQETQSFYMYVVFAVTIAHACAMFTMKDSFCMDWDQEVLTEKTVRQHDASLFYAMRGMPYVLIVALLLHCVRKYAPTQAGTVEETMGLLDETDDISGTPAQGRPRAKTALHPTNTGIYSQLTTTGDKVGTESSLKFV